MDHRENQAKHEIELFELALERARLHGGEARRNVDKLKGDIDESGESPDLVISTKDGRQIGIEHFRVDHFVKSDKKVSSSSAEIISRLESRHKQGYKGNALTEELIQQFGQACSKSIRLSKNACLLDLVRSLEARLFGENGHCNKLDNYKQRLHSINPSAINQTGFLIEFHSNFGGLSLNVGSSISTLENGQLPLYEEIYDLLVKVSHKVDWLILLFCPAIASVNTVDKGERIDAAVIRCTNGLFSKSASRQGLQRTSYLGLGKREARTPQKRDGDVSCYHEDNNIVYSIENTSEEIDVDALWNNALADATSAINIAREGKPFTSTPAVQLVYELVKDRLKFSRKPLTTNDIRRALLSNISE